MLNKLKNFNWTKNMFLVPILLVAGISISHVVSWYDMANPINWAVYLSIAIEIGAMTSLMAATKKIKGGVWFMFGLVTFIQMMGNIFYSYVEIDETGNLFKNWVELTSPLFEMMGTDPTDIIPHKRWLALLEGGLLPLISLTALHFYIKYDDSGEVGSTEEGPTGPSEGPSDGIDTTHIWDKVNELRDNGDLPTPTQEDIDNEPTALANSGPDYWDENPDRELGKYDMKFGPEYTKVMDEIHNDIVEEDEPIVNPLIEEVVEEEPIVKVETKSNEISEDEAERQKHLKFRKRIIEDKGGKKTVIIPKRDKITQKIIK
jgi:hypothetical protein